MFLAEKTVKNYVSNLLAKLGMERRTEAAVFAARLDAPDEAGGTARFVTLVPGRGRRRRPRSGHE